MSSLQPPQLFEPGPSSDYHSSVASGSTSHGYQQQDYDDDEEQMPAPPVQSSRSEAFTMLSPMDAYDPAHDPSSLTSQPMAATKSHPPTHPPSKSATGGQSHAHRPVSAMPTPASHASKTSAGQRSEGDTLGNLNPAYADRRASAHPTMPVSSQSVASGLPQLAMSPSIDPAFASSAINSGIPITSPAALAYFAAHPRRQQVHFGNYLLLQTLGEGEFGKVKLGVHKEWGEEVAVKLIKREKVGAENGQLSINGPPKDPSKMTKVEREIQVLKDVRHPNIVRLYEVIESDRYIGIVLEYASGGELFDHILAHKYLKDRDACRLFAQLISGVNYLHSKKVVHRDLKLENLLLDRNRNVIITDFGFANNFEDKRDDLMATSCGSPCYAAPELVVQDGLYAGSAVDVWSCGVILYAMLAGYLPFDDDPNNPDGDNINLLYKYIMATPLSFPDYIGAEPRDLLSQMLVPDPAARIDLQGVMAHSWLAPYRELFKFTVDELERAAIEQQTKKRQIYRQQMLIQQQMQEQQRQQEALAAQQRSFTSSVSMASGLAPTSTKAQRHQSALPAPTSTSSGAEPPLPFKDNTNRAYDGIAAQGDARGEPRARKDADDEDVENGATTFASEPMVTGKAPAASKPQRHTVQLEYQADPAQAAAKKRDASARTAKASSPKVSKKISAPRMAPSNPDLAKDKNRSPALSTDGDAVPAVPILVPDAERLTTRSASQGSVTAAVLPAALTAPATTTPSKPSPAVLDSTQDSLTTSTPSRRAPSSGGSTVIPEDAVATDVPFPASNVSSQRKSDADNAPLPPSKSRPGSMAPPSASKMDRNNSQHRKRMSVDKSFLNRLLGSANGEAVLDGTQAQGVNAETDDAETARSNSRRRKAMSLMVGSRPSDAAARDRKAVKEERRLTARLRKESTATQTGKSVPASRQSSSSTYATATPSAASMSRSGTQGGSGSGGGSASSRPLASYTAMDRATRDFFDSRQGTMDSSSSVGPSSNAAKKVMDWFRRKSVAKGAFGEPMSPLDASPPPRQEPTVVLSGSVAQADAPTVTVTGADNSTFVPQGEATGSPSEGGPSSRSTSGAYSQVSQSTEATGLTSNTEVSYVSVGAIPASQTFAGAGMASASQQLQNKRQQQQLSGSEQQATPRASANRINARPAGDRSYNENAMRYHLGAVDQSALTSKVPTEVFDEVVRVLYEMGIETRKEREEEFKLECIRRKKPNKSIIGATQGFSSSLRSSVFPPSQADYERGARMSASPSSSGGLAMSPSSSRIGSFLRRGSVTASPTMASVALPDLEGQHSQSSSTGAQPQTIYGETRVDSGQEVRFSVEVTRIKNLPGLYSLDIRRLKGPLTSYKFLYHNILMSTDLGRN